jgi:type VI secretion system protein ImpK
MSGNGAPPPPSLSSGAALRLRKAETGRQPRTLVDLLYDGFYLMFIVRSRYTPGDSTDFAERVRVFLDEFERGAKRLSFPPEDIYDAKYAFCAAMDELILTSHFSVRDEWERQPLQLRFFGEQLAGENFFVKLEDLRTRGAARVQVLEVFYMCLLLGFRGRYLLEGQEKLTYLVARVGEEITHFKGKRAAFAPFWQVPDAISHTLRSEVPVWVFLSAAAFAALIAFVGIRFWLDRTTQEQIAAYVNVIKLPPRTANITITLP